MIRSGRLPLAEDGESRARGMRWRAGLGHPCCLSLLVVVVLRQKVVRAVEALYGDRRGPLEQQLCVLCARGSDWGVRHRDFRGLPSCRLQRRPGAGGSLVWNVTASVRLLTRVGHHARSLARPAGRRRARKQTPPRNDKYKNRLSHFKLNELIKYTQSI